MLRKTLAVISVVSLLLGFALTAWYLTHPESWNWRSFVARFDAGRVREPVTNVVAARSVSASERTAMAEVPASPAVVREEVVAAACSLPDTVSVTSGQDRIIYRWRDGKGVLNVSDQPPRVPTLRARTSRYWAEPAFFELDIDYSGSAEIANFRAELSQDATGIYRILSGLIGATNLRKVQLNIVIHPDRAAYVRYAGAVTGRSMESTNGFYSTGKNEAVTFIQPQREATLATVRHESTHVITTGIFGRIPTWLNEGLAEYFSSLDIIAQVERITLNDASLARARESVRRGYPRRLREFLALTPEAWRDANVSQHYALAEALVFFMMSHDDGRRALTGLLTEAAARYCQQIDTSIILERLYPGGIERLQRDYFNWLIDERPKPPHDY